ncbi:bifunctional folylpolyglutamate synthase/dihydrofolate synthase [Ornithinibacillus bavariensis]|uniref:bifunctional folylpolyglutamate synthase/dihydrofolate synthase n=1 Tax=Ornithinibacillus bavariensis TaxID=545502 RepID=UPI000ED10AA7|nr:bifunctional folylpolyglutamate synthase/dihydrofolate synthase [Ornithinibacillus sp.]
MFTSLEQVNHFFRDRKNYGIKPGLDRMYQLLESQNNPQDKIKAIHIAGTNGKGSTLTYIKEAFIQNNYTVGVFTSPSLTGITGHIYINDKPIGAESFLTYLNKLLPTIERLDTKKMYPTEFEIITVIAFMYFAESVDIALIECGMGGREDATNCISPILSIITNIAMDHAYFLGDTIEKIAYHKAGIIKDQIPTVVGKVDSASLEIIVKEAASKNSTIYQYSQEYKASKIMIQQNSQSFQWEYNDFSLPITINMKGRHQIENASTALMAIHQLIDAGFSLDWVKVQKAFQLAKLEGRFERLMEQPSIIVDGAHNPAGMNAFLQTVQSEYGDREKILIFAGFRDKELKQMILEAIPYFQTVFLTTFDSPRAEEADELGRQLQANNVKINSNWKELVEKVVLSDKESNSAYFFAGSLHFIGLVRSLINSANGDKLSQYM